MKTLANDISTLFTLFAGAKPRILLEITTSGGTVYYSDQYLYIGTQSYQARIKRLGSLRMESKTGENVIREGKIPIVLSNHSPIISDTISPGDTVEMYIWDIGAASGSKFKIFEGTVNDDIRSDYYDFSFTCTDVSAKYNKLIGDKLTDDIWSGAQPDPNDIGKILPIVYGSNKNVRCLAVEAGAATTLSADINDSVTTIPITSSTIPLTFPSTGTIIIGDEEITYSGKTETSFTGATRGANGTTATTHNHGDSVFEDIATLKYLASGRPVKAISNARIIPWGSPIGEAVSVEDFVTSAGYREDDGGYATIELDNIPQLKRKIALDVDPQPDQPVTSNGTHIHTATITGASQATLYGDAVAEQLNASNTGNAYDQNENTFCQLDRGSAPYTAYIGLEFNYSGYNGLSIVEAVACVRHAAGATMDTYRLDLQSLTPDWTQALDQSDTNTKTQKFIVSALNGETDWSLLDGLRVYCNDSNSTVQSEVYEIWWEIKYTPTVAVATHAADGISTSPITTQAGIAGDSVAGSLGGYLVCDIDGEPDSGGHYTGSGTDLIEKPVDIIHHILETHTNGPVAHTNIDLSGSFDDAETNHPDLDKFGFVIRDQIWVNELLALLAQQFFCRFVWEAGIAKLNRIKKPQVWNDVTINYDLDLVASDGKWFFSDAYSQHTQDEDSTSITNNGRKTRVFNAFAVGDNDTMADDLRDKLLSFYKDNRKLLTFPSWTKLFDLERGDEIDITSSQLSLSAFDCEIVNIEFIFPNRRGIPFIIKIIALEI
jgi:hypothetical protein